jgi:hypothetical protein
MSSFGRKSNHDEGFVEGTLEGGGENLAMGGLVLAGRGLPPWVVRHVIVGEASPETLG